MSCKDCGSEDVIKQYDVGIYCEICYDKLMIIRHMDDMKKYIQYLENTLNDNDIVYYRGY